MPTRSDYSDNVEFLFKCIESTGLKIDFSKAGHAIGINPNAARMRYTRLRRAVGPIRSHGSSSLPAPATPTTPATARTRSRSKRTPPSKAKIVKKRKTPASQRDVAEFDSEQGTTSAEPDLLVAESPRKKLARSVQADHKPVYKEESVTSVDIADAFSSEFVDREAVGNGNLIRTLQPTVDHKAERDGMKHQEVNFSNLEAGRKLPSAMVNQRHSLESPSIRADHKTASEHLRHPPVSEPSAGDNLLSSEAGGDSFIRGEEEDDTDDVDIDESVSPDDSISMVQGRRDGRPLGHQETLNGLSMLQRLSSFWK